MAPELCLELEKRGERVDTHGRLVAHHRGDEREREDRLPDPKAPRRVEPRDQEIALTPGRPWCCDFFFGGSGTTGEAAAQNGRGFVLIDHNREAVNVAARQFGHTSRPTSSKKLAPERPPLVAGGTLPRKQPLPVTSAV